MCGFVQGLHGEEEAEEAEFGKICKEASRGREAEIPSGVPLDRYKIC